jgi:glutamine amidotransferase
VVAAADGVVLPGVGNVGRCMEALESTGLDRLARDAAASGRPFLGICVGMQLLYERSDEAPGTPLLGILPGGVHLLPDGVKRPQMQWNVLDRTDRPSGLLEGLDDPAWVYFVHSYAAEDTGDTVATCDYGGPVVAVVERGNVWATQFHPEKSGEVGLAILERFVRRAAATVPAS